ncbi:hypothetical protein D3C71_18640 [compost metagenome]
MSENRTAEDFFDPWPFLKEQFDADGYDHPQAWLEKVVPPYERLLNWTGSEPLTQLAFGAHNWWLMYTRGGPGWQFDYSVATSLCDCLAVFLDNLDMHCREVTRVTQYEGGLAAWRDEELLGLVRPFKPNALGEELTKRCEAVLRGVSLGEFPNVGNRIAKLPALGHLVASREEPALEQAVHEVYLDSAVLFEPGDAAARYAKFSAELGVPLTAAEARSQLSKMLNAKDWHHVMASWARVEVPHPYAVQDRDSKETLFAANASGALGCLELLARKRGRDWAKGHVMSLKSPAGSGVHLHVYPRGTDLRRALLDGESPYVLEARPLEVECSAWPATRTAAAAIAALAPDSQVAALAQELRAGASREEQLLARDKRRASRYLSTVRGVRISATVDRLSERKPFAILEALDERGELAPMPSVLKEPRIRDTSAVTFPLYKAKAYYSHGSLLLTADHDCDVVAFFEDLPRLEAMQVAKQLQLRLWDDGPELWQWKADQDRVPDTLPAWAARHGLRKVT